MTSKKKCGKVAIIFSDNEHESNESKYLAHYFCGLLSNSGFASITMIPYNKENSIPDLNYRRISYIPPNHTKPFEVPVSDVTYSHWSSISECHLVVVTVNATDSLSCGRKLAEFLQNYKNIPVFSLQRGVKQGSLLSDELSSSTTAVIEGAVGFGVVLDPKYSAYVSTVPHPAISFERLTKEQVKIADIPLQLLETMKIDIYFRKFLTPFNYGVLLYENIYALNILTKGSLYDTLQNRQWRLIIALMIRENIQSVAAASKGTWSPQLLLLSTFLTPKFLEMLLIMPLIVCSLGFSLLGIYPNRYLISPGQHDLMENRKTMTKLFLQDMVELGKRYRVASPLSEKVLLVIENIESTISNGNNGNSYTQTNWINSVENDVVTLYPTHDSMTELFYWLSRIIAVLSVLLLVGFLFYHD